jgi:hypothetical protein
MTTFLFARRVSLVAAVCLLLSPTGVRANVVLWIDDGSNNIGTVDITTGTVTVVGNAGPDLLTDIGFAADGTLYGTSFTNFYSINQTNGAATFIGNYGGLGNDGMNALIGAPGGVLYAASNATTDLYSVVPSPFGLTTLSGSTGAESAGDLAASGGSLYLSGLDPSNGNDELVKLSVGGGAVTSTIIGDFTQGGATFTGVFGLSDDGTTMYAVNGTTVYSVDLATAQLSTVLDYSGHGLGGANGAAFVNESSTTVPEPGSGLTLGTALLGFGLLVRFRRLIAAPTASPARSNSPDRAIRAGDDTEAQAR